MKKGAAVVIIAGSDAHNWAPVADRWIADRRRAAHGYLPGW
jgi:hypothetical protein